MIVDKRKLLLDIAWRGLVVIAIMALVAWRIAHHVHQAELQERCQEACNGAMYRVGTLLDETPPDPNQDPPWYLPGERRCACSNPELLSTEGW